MSALIRTRNNVCGCAEAVHLLTHRQRLLGGTLKDGEQAWRTGVAAVVNRLEPTRIDPKVTIAGQEEGGGWEGGRRGC